MPFDQFLNEDFSWTMATAGIDLQIVTRNAITDSKEADMDPLTYPEKMILRRSFHPDGAESEWTDESGRSREDLVYGVVLISILATTVMGVAVESGLFENLFNVLA